MRRVGNVNIPVRQHLDRHAPPPLFSQADSSRDELLEAERRTGKDVPIEGSTPAADDSEDRRALKRGGKQNGDSRIGEPGGGAQNGASSPVPPCSRTLPLEEDKPAPETATRQKQGRAQKKRARKVKEKMRQICIEVAATTAAAAAAANTGTAVADTATAGTGTAAGGDAVTAAAGVIAAGTGIAAAAYDTEAVDTGTAAAAAAGTTADAGVPSPSFEKPDSTRTTGPDQGGGGKPSVRSNGGDDTPQGTSHLPPRVTPWPRLESVARDLAALAWARSQQHRTVVVSVGAGAPRGAPSAAKRLFAETPDATPVPMAANSDANGPDAGSSSDARAANHLLAERVDATPVPKTASSIVNDPDAKSPSDARTAAGIASGSSKVEANAAGSSSTSQQTVLSAGRGAAERGVDGGVVHGPAVAVATRQDRDVSQEHTKPAVVCGAIDFDVAGPIDASAPAVVEEVNAQETSCFGVADAPRKVARGNINEQALADIDAGKDGAAVALTDGDVAVSVGGEAVPTAGEAAIGGGGAIDGAIQATAGAAVSHRKTRRGKRAGGAINKRRGAKEREALSAFCEGALPSGEGTIPFKGEDLPRETATTVDNGSTNEASSARSPRLEHPSRENSVKKVAQQRAPADGVEVGRDSGKMGVGGVAAGAHGWGVNGESGGTCSMNGASSEALLRFEPSAVDLPGLECAARRSLRELRAMSVPASAVTLAENGKVGSASSMPALGLASRSAATGGGKSRVLQEQLRARGVLESLVALCAPFPWVPVSVSLAVARGGEGRPLGGLSRPRPSLAASLNGAPTLVPDPNMATSKGAGNSHSSSSLRGTMAPDYVAPVGMAAMNSVKGGNPSVPQTRNDGAPRAESAPVSSENKKAAAKAVGGMDSSGRGGGDSCNREALTECALDALLTALSEPRNRDHVLRVDGAAPIVRWLVPVLPEKGAQFFFFLFHTCL